MRSRFFGLVSKLLIAIIIFILLVDFVLLRNVFHRLNQDVTMANKIADSFVVIISLGILFGLIKFRSYVNKRRKAIDEAPQIAYEKNKREREAKEAASVKAERDRAKAEREAMEASAQAEREAMEASAKAERDCAQAERDRSFAAPFKQSSYFRKPVDLAEWERSKKDYEKVIELLEMVSLRKSDQMAYSNFPLKKHEVVFLKTKCFFFDGKKNNDFDFTEHGHLYITSQRCYFVGQTISQEWLYRRMIDYTAFDERMTLVFNSTERVVNIGVRFRDQMEWYRAQFFLGEAYESQLKSLTFIQEMVGLLNQYLELRPRTS